MKRNRFSVLFVVLLTAFCAAPTFAADSKKSDEPQYDALAESQKDADQYDWTVLFNGETLTNWIDLEDAGAARVVVEDGALILGMGATSTSVKLDEETLGESFPRENYELEYVARRQMGTDFFSGATFPVGDDYLTLVNGGWGGGVFGLSSIDEMDASENSTSSFYNFKNKRWYRFRIQVTKRAIRVFVDDEQLIDYVLENHRLGTRYEVSRCRPLGFASWVSRGEIKTIRVRALTDDELKYLNDRADEEARFFTN